MNLYSPSAFLRFAGFICAIILIINACSNKDDASPSAAAIFTKGNIDSILYVESSAASEQFLPYQNVDSIRPSSAFTAHADFFKVRLNAKARSVLGADGRLPTGKSFPEGSIIVKDLYSEKTGARKLVAIMKKESANPYSNQNWLWTELLGDGGAYVTVKDKGAQCVNCHSQNSRDFVRVFDLF